jgi:hypothetical protein
MAFTTPSFQRTSTRLNYSNSIPPSVVNHTTFSRLIQNAVKPPGVTFNTQLNLNVGGRKPSSSGSNSRSSSSSNNNSGDSGGGSGNRNGRPHSSFQKKSSRGYYPLKDSNVGSQSFFTDIPSGIISNPSAKGSSFTGSTLFTMSGSFFPNFMNQPYVVKETIEDRIFFNIITKIYGNVNRNLERQISKTSLYDYINKLSDALQLYYSVESVLAYQSKFSNMNSGMTHLRSLYSADILSAHENLKRTLVQSAIPPNLLAFISYMYQNFKFDTTENAPIYKLAFKYTNHSGSQSLSPDIINVINAELQECYKINALLLKAIPSYTVYELLPCSAEPIFDRNFMSFWYNSNLSFMHDDKQTLKYTRNIDNSDEEKYYGHFCPNDSLDGIYYACTSLHDSTKGWNLPGFWCPISSAEVLKKCDDEEHSSLLCYDSDYRRMISPKSHQVATQSGLFHSIYSNRDGKGEYSQVISINPAAQTLQHHSLSNLDHCASQSVLFLLGSTD